MGSIYLQSVITPVACRGLLMSKLRQNRVKEDLLSHIFRHCPLDQKFPITWKYLLYLQMSGLPILKCKIKIQR